MSYSECNICKKHRDYGIGIPFHINNIPLMCKLGDDIIKKYYHKNNCPHYDEWSKIRQWIYNNF